MLHSAIMTLASWCLCDNDMTQHVEPQTDLELADALGHSLGVWCSRMIS